MFTNNKSYFGSRFLQPIDVWSGWHLFGSFFLFCLIAYFGALPFTAWLIAIGFGLVWEAYDELYHQLLQQGRVSTAWKARIDNVFDQRGFCLIDLAMDIIGATLAYWLTH